jgi:hypothetical protein
MNDMILPTTAERVNHLKAIEDVDDAQHFLRYICGEREMWKQALARSGDGYKTRKQVRQALSKEDTSSGSGDWSTSATAS